MSPLLALNFLNVSAAGATLSADEALGEVPDADADAELTLPDPLAEPGKKIILSESILKIQKSGITSRIRRSYGGCRCS